MGCKVKIVNFYKGLKNICVAAMKTKQNESELN